MSKDLSDEAGAFDFASLDGSTPKLKSYPAGPCLRSLIACLATMAIVAACGWSPPAWFQPTHVGVLWASLFLVGAAAGSVRRGDGLFAVVAGGYVWISQLAMQSLTSLVAAECGLVVVCAFSAGWLVSQFDYSGRSPKAVKYFMEVNVAGFVRNRISYTTEASPVSHETSYPIRENTSQQWRSQQTTASEVQRYKQWTIWDLAILTTLVAVICYALPRLESPLALLSQVGFVLWGGSLCGWIAYRWVFDDRWTLSKLFVLLVGSGLCFGLLGLGLFSRQTPIEFSLLHIATWMMTGPIAVVAAQALTVLVLLTAIRIDQGSLSASKQFIPLASAT